MILMENAENDKAFGFKMDDEDNLCVNKENIPKACEILNKEVNNELKIFRDNFQKYKKNTQRLDKKNEFLSKRLEEIKFTSVYSLPHDDASMHEISNTEEIANLRKQMELLKSENGHLRQLQKNTQKTISSLELELKDYRRDLGKQSNNAEIINITGIVKSLEKKINMQQEALDQQNQIIIQMTEEKSNHIAEIEKLKGTLKERNDELECKSLKDDKIKHMEEELNKHKLINEKSENTLKELSSFIDEQLAQKNDALSRVEEALNLAQEAIRDREEAYLREHIVKEECNTLANTIGAVMDEASRKVDKDFELLQQKFNKNEKTLIDTIENMHTVNEQQKQHINLLERRMEKLNEKLQNVQSESMRYQVEYNIIKNSFNEIEERLHSSVSQLQNQQMALKQVEELEIVTKNLLQSNHGIKSKYMTIFEEISLKFQNQISKLREENHQLKSELEILKKETSKEK